MKHIEILEFLNPIENYLNSRILNGKYWKFKTLFFTLFISFSFLFIFNRGYVLQNGKNFYLDSVLHKSQPYFFWDSIVEQGKSPLAPNTHQQGTHESNRTFRLVIPLISRTLSIEGLGLFSLQIFLGLCFLYLLLNILNKILSDKILIFYTFIAFVNVYAGSCFFINCFGHGDGYTYFFIILSLLFRNPILQSTALQLSFWCDERSIIVVLGVLLFQYLYYQLSSKNTLILFGLIALNVVIYGILRIYLTTTFHLQSADVENSSIERFTGIAKYISTWWGNRMYVGLEGFTLILLVTFLILCKEKKRQFIGIWLIYWIPIILITVLVADTVRTISFTFVFWLVCINFLKEKVSSTQLKYLFFIVAFINVLIPIIFP